MPHKGRSANIRSGPAAGSNTGLGSHRCLKISSSSLILGRGERGAREALFLRTYSPQLTLLTDGERPESLAEPWRKRLQAAGVELLEAPVLAVRRTCKGVAVKLADDQSRRGRALYVALGVGVRTGLATALGARHDAQGYLEVDRHQQATVPGLYAAGDVVQSLSQISVGFGQAAIAASAIHQALLPELPV